MTAKLYKLHRLITIIKLWIEEENSIYLRMTQWNFNKGNKVHQMVWCVLSSPLFFFLPLSGVSKAVVKKIS